MPRESAVQVREVDGLTVGAAGAVVRAPEVGWVVTDAAGEVVTAAYAFMVELTASGCSPSTRRSYAYDLLRWWRFCAAIEVPWQQAGRQDVRDFVRWLQVRPNPQRRRADPGDRSGSGRPAAGSVNPETGKVYLPEGYAPRTVNHALSVICSFYAFAVETGLGPFVNPVPTSPGGVDLRHRAHRATYRQKQPVQQPRDISEDLLQRIFAVLRNDRDRAMVAVALSSGVRASELLSMTLTGMDSGRGVLSVVGKGRGGQRVWVPAAPESFVWIGRYLTDLPDPVAGGPLWRTLRPPHSGLTYFGLRQVLERVNAKLETNLTWHDFRHTFAHRLLADQRLSLVDVQMLLRHRNLSTLQAYAATRLDELVASLHRHLAQPPPPPPAATVGPQFAAADMRVLFPNMPW